MELPGKYFSISIIKKIFYLATRRAIYSELLKYAFAVFMICDKMARKRRGRCSDKLLRAFMISNSCLGGPAASKLANSSVTRSLPVIRKTVEIQQVQNESHRKSVASKKNPVAVFLINKKLHVGLFYFYLVFFLHLNSL